MGGKELKISYNVYFRDDFVWIIYTPFRFISNIKLFSPLHLLYSCNLLARFKISDLGYSKIRI